MERPHGISHAHNFRGTEIAADFTEAGPGTDNRYWDRGITILRNAKDGTADVEWWSMERVRLEYGRG
jgi:hypothetical protein